MGQRVAVYLRISDDREGQRLGVERQREDCLARADREGWEVVEVFEDNDIGASAKSRKARPGYARMIAKAQAGEVDVLMAYSNSRLTRRPMEFESLIELSQTTGVRICTVVSGDDDLSTADGRMVARIKANIDAAEAERISERVARAAKQRREQGKFHGGFPPYGYERAPGGALVINPERAAVVREARDRILGGESLYGVWTDLNRRGIKTGPGPRAPHGARWQSQTLKRVLTSPAAIGCLKMDDGTLRQVAEPILDPTSWQRLNELLYDDRRWSRSCPPDWSSRRKYPLSGLLTCSGCGHLLSGSKRAARPDKSGSPRPSVTSFICNRAQGGCGKIRIDYAPVEAWVLGHAFARFDVPGVQAALSARDAADHNDELRQQIADAQRRLEHLDDLHADGVLDDQRYRRQVDRLTKQLAEMRTTLADRHKDIFMVDTDGRSLRDVWHEHDVTWQRTLLGHVIDRIEVRPHPAGVTTNVSPRRGESDESVAKRREEHRDLLLAERVLITWKA